MKFLLLLAAVIGSSFLITSCNKDDDDIYEDVVIYPFVDLGIPYGHLPPPGECKIWIPGLPAGQQGPPQSCESAMFNAPLGAWVIARTDEWYEVHVLSGSRPHVVIDILYYGFP
jgi:hypothetical protein